MKKTIQIFLILFSFSTLKAQENIKISTPIVSFINNILTIEYDITGCMTGAYIEINLLVLNSEGDTLKPQNINGDFGSNVSCGFGKKIEWNILKDSILINDELKVQIIGTPFIPEVISQPVVKLKAIPRSNIIFSSFFLPGLGQKKASGKKGYILFSGMVYGAIGSSIYNYYESKKYYDLYLTRSGLDSDIDGLFNKSIKHYNISQYMLYGATGLWAINMIWSAAIPIKETARKKIDLSLISLPQNGYMVSAKWTF